MRDTRVRNIPLTPPRYQNHPALARRDLLRASGVGVAAIVAAPSCAQAPPAKPATQTSLIEGASARAFGAIGDGQFHPLSSRFPTLAAAQAVYPFVERLDQSIDWAGIQAAINSIEASGGTATIPVGRFAISDSIQLPSHVTLRGESRNGTIIDNQYHPLAAPQLVNKDPIAFLYATIRDLTFHGGTHAIKIRATREVAGIVIQGVTTNLQSESNITFSSMQTTVIRDCHLMNGKYGVSVEGFPCNSIHLDNTRLGDHSDASIRLRGVDGFVMFGGSIEGSGAPGRGTIDIETGGAYANAIHFQNVYFENTHEFLLRSRGAKTVVFRGCKITGTGAAGKGMGPYHFDCADDLIVFDDNHWDLPTPGPRNMLMKGRNDGLGGAGTLWSERSGRSVRLESRRFAAGEVGRGLFTVDFGGQGGRVYGTLEMFFDTGDTQPIKRVAMPIDIAVSTQGAAALARSPTGEVQLVASVANKLLTIGMKAGAGIGSYRRLWYTLDVAADTPGAMSVGVL